MIKEQLKQENERKLFEKLLLTTIRPEFNNGGVTEAVSIVLFDRFWIFFIAFSVVSFRCFGGFRSFGVSGFSTCRRKSVHKFWKNSQFPFWTRGEESAYPRASCKKNSPSGTRPTCVFRSLKNSCFSDVIKLTLKILFEFLNTNCHAVLSTIINYHEVWACSN